MGWLRRVRAGLAAAENASELAVEVQSCTALVGDLTDSVDTLREALVDQQRRSDQMLTEWATTLDKIGRWASRQSARERKDTHTKLDTLAGDGPKSGRDADPSTLTKPQLRALAARMRMGHVASNDGG